MSVVKTNACQLGQSLTATNNFTWYQPATPDGTVRLGNGNSGSVTDLVTLTSAGNLGIGTSSPLAKLQVKSTNPQIWMEDSAAGTNGKFTAIGTSNGVMTFSRYLDNGSLVAQYMTLDASGNLGLGVTPSGWGSGTSAFDLASGGSAGALSASGTLSIARNGYFNGTNWIYKNSFAAQMIQLTAYGTMAFNIAGSGTAGNAISFTQAMTLDASGNLLVGTTSATAKLTVEGSIKIGYGSPLICYTGGTQLVNTVLNNYYDNNGNDTLLLKPSGVSGGGQIILAGRDGTERARIDSSGNLLVGTTTISDASQAALCVYATFPKTVVELRQSGTSQHYAITFRNGNGLVGNINTSGTTTSYVTSSDQRLKENIVDAPGALDSINAIKVRSFDWRVDGSHVNYGYIAQELLEVVPEAVSVPADPDEMMGVDFGKLTPRLVKAIQELSAELNELKQKVNA